MIAVIASGIHPQSVRIETKRIAPHPLSNTDSGGHSNDRMALKMFMALLVLEFNITFIVIDKLLYLFFSSPPILSVIINLFCSCILRISCRLLFSIIWL